jgi:signal recognition particle receptor subunit beta
VPEQTEPQKIRLTLSPQAERYARRDAPREARLMAARGALPLPPLELATVLFVLHHDPDPEIKSTARDSLESLPDSVRDAVLSGPAHPALLSHFAHVFRDDASRLEKIALNPAADDGTLAFLASTPFTQIVEIISHNQERMLRAPEIVDALGANRLTGRAVIDRILAFLEVERDPEDAVDEAATPETISDAQAEAALRAVLGEEMGAFARQLVEERDGEVDEEHPDLSLYALIQKMTVFQKIRLGRMGNKEARGLLVRDRNKIVAIGQRDREHRPVAQRGGGRASPGLDEPGVDSQLQGEARPGYESQVPPDGGGEVRELPPGQGPAPDHAKQGRTLGGGDPRAPHPHEEGKALMAKASRDRAEVNARVVYWGVEGGGKRANLNTVFAKLRADHRGDLRSEPTSLDPSVAYQVLPIELGEIAGVRTRIEMVAAPGGPEQAPTRKQLLDQVDGLVLVLDSQGEKVDENVKSFQELRQTLASYGRRLEDVPLVVQYNKRDLADAYAVEELHRRLDLSGAAVFEAVASEGTGVLETLSTISKRVIRSLRDQADEPKAVGEPEVGAQPVAAAGEPEAIAQRGEAERSQILSPPGSPSPHEAPPPPPEVAPPEAGELEPKPLEELEITTPTERMEGAILEEEEHPESSQIAAAAHRAETLLDAPVPGALDEIGKPTAVRLGPDVSIVSVGEALRVGDRSVRLPLVLGDAEGRSTTLVLTIQLDPLLDEAPT